MRATFHVMEISQALLKHSECRRFQKVFNEIYGKILFYISQNNDPF